MFFKLCGHVDQRYPRQFSLGGLTLNTDRGWSSTSDESKTWVFKGYAIEFDLASNLDKITSDHQHSGNYCVFLYDHYTKQTSLLANKWRGFPLWCQPNQYLSNLDTAAGQIWSDSQVVVSPQLDLTETKLDIIGQIDTTTKSLEEVLDFVHHRIDTTVQSFLTHNTKPIRVFCSGGVDTMLVYSYMRRHTDDLELIFENRIQWDEFWCQNRKLITQSFWSYNQIHHWLDPCVLTSGTPGDEFTLRSPTTANLYLRYHGTSIPQQLASHLASLHHEYFSQPKHTQIFEQQQKERIEYDWSIEQLYRHLCNIVVNDYQHWHLGETLTFTPLRDLEIFKMILRLDLPDAMSQIFDSNVSRHLIARNDPTLLDYLSPTKNHGESWCNLVKLMRDHGSRA
jgi:hypothetical protein